MKDSSVALGDTAVARVRCGCVLQCHLSHRKRVCVCACVSVCVSMHASVPSHISNMQYQLNKGVFRWACVPSWVFFRLIIYLYHVCSISLKGLILTQFSYFLGDPYPRWTHTPQHVTKPEDQHVPACFKPTIIITTSYIITNWSPGFTLVVY